MLTWIAALSGLTGNPTIKHMAMRIQVVTLFPSLIQDALSYGVTSRALDKGLAEIGYINPRDYTTDRHRTVDDRPYGGGPGMVLKPEPVSAAIKAAGDVLGGGARVVHLSPQGKRLDQQAVARLGQLPGLVLIAGRYEGIDERVIDQMVDEECSLGDYVLTGGELAVAVLVDAMMRLLPGALGDEHSAEQDSFVAGLLDCAHYTRPEVFAGEQVPQVLLSGDHEAIRRWRLKQALGRTWLRRPDLLDNIRLDEEQQVLLAEFQSEHGINE